MDIVKFVRDQRAAKKTELEQLTASHEARGAEATDEERSAFDVAFADGLKKIAEFDERIAELQDAETRAAAAEAAAAIIGAGPAIVRSEPTIYGKGSGNSYFLDIARSHTGRGDAVGAVERLQRHAKESEVELEARASRGVVTPFEKRVNPNRTDGQGGYFVPPVWLVDEYVKLPRAARPLADAVRNLSLPSGTDSINIPKVSTGVTTAIQTADAAAVSSTDLTDTSVSAGVKTIAGQQDIALQLLEQSPIAFDEVIFDDLMRAYASNVDTQCLAGTNANGQVKGLDQISPNTITYTDASPTGPELYPSLAGAISQIARQVYGTESITIFMHPVRWYWLASQLDTTNRPLVVPGPAFNAYAEMGNAAQGPVGQILGVPVVLDPNITTTAGGGTEDKIYVVKTNEVFLFEGELRTRALTEVLSGTLQVRLQVYNYLAFLADRLPKATTIISGTGLAAPSGF